MENATKALIIAGSVLVAILVIAFGMRIFRDGSQPVQVQGDTMETTAIATFNSQFAGYAGQTLTSSKANNLVQKVIASNAKSSHKVGIGSYTATNLPANLNNAITYLTGRTVNLTYGANGYITTITGT